MKTSLKANYSVIKREPSQEPFRIGDNRVIHVKVRVIAATNQNLEKMVSTGQFREDLYHRLNVVRIATTLLRGRMEDIPDLAQLFVLQIGGPNFKISDRAQYALKNYDWPGNIRELRNAIERSVISARQRKSFEIGFDDITIHQMMKGPAYELRKIEASLPAKVSDLTPQNYRDFVEAAERAYFQSALAAVGGNAEDLAHRIDLGRSTTFKKIRNLGCKEKSLSRRN
ncbi:MAG: sigma-54-dependent Fis family transcriptional regulator [Bdellovibrionales bacterium]|nr:sigma-54-dependent Fis family transcriptional regulator [Bdellovibrionales bacterium]